MPDPSTVRQLWLNRRERYSESKSQAMRVRNILSGRFDTQFRDLMPPGEEPVVANLIKAAARTTMQRVGHMPKLHAVSKNNSRAARERAERHEHTLTRRLEDMTFDMMLRQGVYWLTAHGYLPLTLRYDHRLSQAVIDIRDPLTAYPDTVWPHRPEVHDCLFTIDMPPEQARLLYPDRNLDGYLSAVEEAEGPVTTVTVAEYHTPDMIYLTLVAPGSGTHLDEIPNPLGRPTVWVARDVSDDFDFQGSYDQLVPTLFAQAKLFALLMSYADQQVFAEALALDTPLPTPDGWTTMGEVDEGDLLIGSDGLPVEVLKATEVQTDRYCYEVTFEDGTSMIASDGHLWLTRCGDVFKVRNTQEMVDANDWFFIPSHDSDWVAIKSITSVPSVPVRCVAVDSSDHLFQAGEGAHLTHNTAVIGEITSNQGKWAFGPGAVNTIQPAPNAQVQKLINNASTQVFSEMDRLERAQRLGGNFPPALSGEPVASVATGRGIEQLLQAPDANVHHFQLILTVALREVLNTLPEFEQKWGVDDSAFSSDVRVYPRFQLGTDPSTNVMLLQRNAAGMMSRETVMDQDPTIDNPHEELARVQSEGLNDALMSQLQSMAAEGQLPPGIIVELRKRLARGETIGEAYDAIIQQQREEQQAQESAPPPAAAPPGEGQGMGTPPLQSLIRAGAQGQNIGGVSGTQELGPPQGGR